MVKSRLNITVDKEVYKEFTRICDEECIIKSKRIEKFMKEFIENFKKKMKNV
ncbi:hypothetical protein J4209_04040 [Candidatus Woesearchaeota archaeon]|nr:hypothetical protein [Candidatus Woesearchaeota archaeon]